MPGKPLTPLGTYHTNRLTETNLYVKVKQRDPKMVFLLVALTKAKRLSLKKTRPRLPYAA